MRQSPALGMTPGVANPGRSKDLEGRAAGQEYGLAGIGLGMRVVDDLGDLHELDAGRNTVKTGHSVPQLLGEEAFRCFLRVQRLMRKSP